MITKGGKIGKVLGIFFVLFIAVLGFFTNNSWGQGPTVISTTPTDKSINVPINSTIEVVFDTGMDTGAGWFVVEDEYDNLVNGTVQWTSTVHANDTLVFILGQALKPATPYTVKGMGVSSGGETFFEFTFITKHSSADSIPPTIQTVYPYNGMTGVSTTTEIICKFSEAMNPSTITSSNVRLAGPGIFGPEDYMVAYEFEDAVALIKPNTPLTASNTYTVTIKPNVKDLRGNWLKEQYQWSFTTGATDTTNPTVSQTIPANGANKVSPSVRIHVGFSEMMNESTLNSSHITLYDNTGVTPIGIYIAEAQDDFVTIAPWFGTSLQHGHNYTVTVGTGVTDLAGNSLPTDYVFSFTVAGEGEDSDPVVWSISIQDHKGKRWSDGSTRLELELGAWDDVTTSLSVTATTPPSYSWNLTASWITYSYESTGDEGLSSGTHTLTYTIKDGALNQVTFQRDIYIFDAVPALASPAYGATSVSTFPTFQWNYNGSLRPFLYVVEVFDGPNPETARMVWRGHMSDRGPGIHTIAIPADKPLAPTTTYYWRVKGPNFLENGQAYSPLRLFTTGGTPPPAPTFQRVVVRSDDQLPPVGLRWNLMASVVGPSPADIAESKVTGPGGFQYIFTEDDIQQGEQMGLHFWRAIPDALPDGTYTFTVKDSMGRIATENFVFTNPSSTIPRVDSSTMLPGDSSYVNSETPTFGWTGVGSGYYYRVRVLDWNSKIDAVYYSDYTQDTQITLPSGYLLPNTPYRWHVEVFDAPWENRSRSETLRFSTGSPTYALDLTWGHVWGDNGYYNRSTRLLCANVIGPLPNEVAQINVTGPSGFNYSFMESDISYDLVTQGIQYCHGEGGFPADGTYNFYVQDTHGASDSHPKVLTSTEIPVVEQSSLFPANNAYLNTLTPTFTWTAVGGTNRYYRVKINDWMLRYTIYSSPRSTDIYATIPSGILKPNRSYKWRVEVFDHSSGVEAGSRSNSAWNSFTTIFCSGAVTLISPSGTIAVNTPTYTWNADPSAIYYQLVVTDSTGPKIQQWYTAAAVGCGSGTGTCSVTPSTAVAVGAAEWKVQTYDNHCGYGPWSSSMSFTVKCVDEAATLISPSGTITDITTPTYTWNAVSGAIYYQLVVTDSTGPKIQQWYTAAAAGCPAGTGTCSVTPSTAVAVGAAEWKVQVYGNCGYGPWSSPLSFTVKCLDAPTLVSPSGISVPTSTPTYTWNAVSGAIYYQLVVTDPTGTKVQQWYTAAATGCPAGTGTCSVTPATALAVGAYEWKVQTYGNCGYDLWSSPASFTVKCMDEAATLVSPSGISVPTSTPTYTWNAVSGAIYYQLVVTDSTGTKVPGTGTCSATPAAALALGAYEWKVQTYGNCGYGPWSSPASFTVGCMDEAATLISPSGTIMNKTPTYTWNAVSGAIYYQLVVSDSVGTKFQQWYSAAGAGCPAGTGTCSRDRNLFGDPGGCLSPRSI